MKTKVPPEVKTKTRSYEWTDKWHATLVEGTTRFQMKNA